LSPLPTKGTAPDLVVRQGSLSLRLSPDRMHALLELPAGHGEDPAQLRDRLDKLLNSQGVVHGIDQHAIDHILAGSGGGEGREIARGTPARNGNPQVEKHFSSALLSTGTQEGAEGEEGPPPCETIELVRQGKPIASVVLTGLVKAGSDIQGRPVAPKESVVLAAGANTVLSADRTILRAAVSGYPKLRRQQGPDGDVEVIELDPVVRLENEGMTATMTLLPSLPGQPALDIKALEELLHEAGVVFGIDTSALHRLAEHLATSIPAPLELLVARGRLPRQGEDAYLRFEVEIGPLPGKLLEDGSMDFRERRMFVGVRSGEVLACKVPATMGEAGCDVLGRPAPARPGRDLVVKVSDDAAFDAQSGEVRAVKSGVLSLVQENSLKVCSMQVIPGDINYATGNVDSRNSVAVNGSIMAGFIIRAGGDVEVKGNLNGGSILCGGNVVLHGGINGAASRIEAQGDADLKFINRGQAVAGGRAILRRESYYGTIHACGDIACEPSSRILGGEIVAGGKVVTGHIGSATAEPAYIAAAVDPQLFQQQQELLRQLGEKEAAWMQLEQRLGHDPNSPGAVRLVKELSRLQNRLADLSLIPPSLRDTRGQLLNPHQLGIDVHGTVFANTILRIGDVTQSLNADTSHKRFRLEPTGRTIVATSL